MEQADTALLVTLILALGLAWWMLVLRKKTMVTAASSPSNSELIKRDRASTHSAVDSAVSCAVNASNQPTADPKSIAVLPFRDMSREKDQEYFSDGMAEEILSLLTRIPNLKVIARTSSFSLKNRDVEIKDIAVALNVAHVLEGSVQMVGDKLRIKTQLIKADDGFVLWSQGFDRKLEDVFQIQDAVARAIAQQLHVTLLERDVKTETQSVNLEAYDLVLRGRFFNYKGFEGAAQSTEYFERALAIDPEYAPALYGISLNTFMLAAWGFCLLLNRFQK